MVNKKWNEFKVGWKELGGASYIIVAAGYLVLMILPHGLGLVPIWAFLFFTVPAGIGIVLLAREK